VLRIKIKINFPLFTKEKTERIENIEFSKINRYMNELKNNSEISKYYKDLEKSYEKFISKLSEVKKSFENLGNKDGIRFIPFVKNNLEMIKELNEFNIHSFQKFYTDTFSIMRRMIKTYDEIQDEISGYENGERILSSLNSLFKDLDGLKKSLAKRHSEYSMINHFENASKKYSDIQEFIKKDQDLEKKINLVAKEEKITKETLKEKIKDFQSIESKIESKKITELKKQIFSLEDDIAAIKSDLKINLLAARRQISKILHSRENKKIFNFFQEFANNPLDNVNENFWELTNLLKDTKFNKEINEFLKFSENELNDKISKCKNLENNKRDLKHILKELLSKNKEIEEKFEKEKNDAEQKFKKINKKLTSLSREKTDLEVVIKQNIKILEDMISKLSNQKITIKLN